MDRKANVVWEGSLQEGKGEISTASGALAGTPYSFSSRFESGAGTNPEELIAAAHAACFSMAFSHELGKRQIQGARIRTQAKVKLALRPDGWSVTHIQLDAVVKAPGSDPALIETAGQIAKESCPISRALHVPIDLTVRVELEAVREPGEFVA